MDDRLQRSRLRTLGGLVAVAALVVGACTSGASPSTAGSSAPAASCGAAPSSAPSGSGAAAGTKHVAILNKDMTDDEIKAAIAAEGTVNVGNWTYAATKEIVKQFQKYVKDTYGADIKLNYVGTQQPSEYLT